METSKNKQDVSHIEPDNDKTLRRRVLCPGIYIENRVYSRFMNYRIGNSDLFKFAKKRMKCFEI